MRRVVIATAAAALTLVLSACGGGGGGGTSVGSQRTESTQPAQPQTPASFDGSWTGTTSQGKSVSFTVAAGVVTRLSIAYKHGGANCHIVNTKLTGTLKTPLPITNGHFKISAFTGKSVFAGTFTSSTVATGTGHFKAPPQDQPSCTAANVTWHARR